MTDDPLAGEDLVSVTLVGEVLEACTPAEEAVVFDTSAVMTVTSGAPTEEGWRPILLRGSWCSQLSSSC